MKFSHIIKNVVAIIVFALLPLSASAKCGNVDYSWGADARLCGDDDAVCAVSDIRRRCSDGDNLCIADIHQDEYRRRRCDQIDSDSDRSLSVYDRSIHPVPCILWLPDLRLNCRRVYIKVRKQYHRAVCQKGKTSKAWKKTGDKGENELRREIINK